MFESQTGASPTNHAGPGPPLSDRGIWDLGALSAARQIILEHNAPVDWYLQSLGCCRAARSNLRLWGYPLSFASSDVSKALLQTLPKPPQSNPSTCLQPFFLFSLCFFFFEDSHPFLPFVSFLFFSFRECGACSSGYFFFLRFLLRGMPIAYLVQSPASNIFLLMRTPPSFFHLIYPQPLYEERPRRSSLWTFFFNFIFLRFFGLLLQLAPVPVACSYSYSHTASE